MGPLELKFALISFFDTTQMFEENPLIVTIGEYH